MPSFLERYLGTPLGEVFGDQTPVSIFDAELAWMGLPGMPFLDFAENVKPAPYDVPINDPAVFRDGATFLLAQAHRIWLTAQLIDQYLPAGAEAVMLDLGGYPFAIEGVVRQFLKRECRIIATYAQALSGDALALLARSRIELLPVNLDPRVRVDSPLPGMTDLLPIPDNSMDLVLMAHVIEHLYQPIQILQDAFRVLKPGGKLLLTTDHGFLIGGFLNYLNNGEFVHEPVEGTAAMVFTEWRGHVRFYTEGDLRKLLVAAGGRIVESQLQEVLYNSVPAQYFVRPALEIPRWRANLLAEFPAFRNEVMMVAEKPGLKTNPVDPVSNSAELQGLAKEFESGECHLDRSTLPDLAFGSRLLFGRWPTQREIEEYRSSPPARGLDGLVDMLLSSPEAAVRPLAARLERPGPSCIVMTETQDGLRFFFSAQDTFVGFPVAVEVFERDVCAALGMLVRKNMTCLDIGANFGFHAVRMAALTGQGGKVYAIEPDPFSYSLLLRNIAENRMEGTIRPFNAACGEKEDIVRLRKHPNPANLGGSWILRTETEHDTGIEVSLRPVDDVIPSEELVDVVKMDVKGHELFVLQGMRRTVLPNRPAIVCEFDASALNQHGPDMAEQFLSELAAFKYTVYEAVPFAEGARTAFKYDRRAPAVVRNLVCLPEGHTLR